MISILCQIDIGQKVQAVKKIKDTMILIFISQIMKKYVRE